MRHLDLFSGIGGFALAARWVGWETLGFCEIDPYCQKVLRKHWPDVPIHEDIKDYDGQECDIITAGFPCQPYSVAGERRGKEDDRALWPNIVRILDRQRPRWFIGENVTGFINLGLDQALLDLAEIGYAARTLNLPACSVNAPHTRQRIWIIANTKRHVIPRKESCGGETRRVGREQQPFPWDRAWEDAVAHARRVDDGVSGRMVTDRADAIRNAIVPQVAEQIFRSINEMGHDHLQR